MTRRYGVDNPIDHQDVKEQNKTSNSNEMLNPSNEIMKHKESIIASVKSINDKIFKLLSGYKDVLYDIQNKLKKIPDKKSQLFSVSAFIVWEANSCFARKDPVFYREILKPLFGEYGYCLNSAKQNLEDTELYELYSNLFEKIEKAETEKPQQTSNTFFSHSKDPNEKTVFRKPSDLYI